MSSNRAITCVSAGYEGWKWDAFVAALQRARVSLVADVRASAWSMRPDFRKHALLEGLTAAGIKYEHYPEVGNPFRPKPGTRHEAADWVPKYRDFLREQPERMQSLLRVMRRRRVALLCFEARHEECHRSVLLDELAALADPRRVKFELLDKCDRDAP